MKWVEDIIEEARTKGACRLADGITEERDLINLLFSPQGREFCELHQFPSRECWNTLTHLGLSRYNVYVNEGRLRLKMDSENVAVIGSTDAEIMVSGVERKHTIIVGHDAYCKVIARDRAVFEIVKIGRCKCEIDMDETSVRL